MTESSPSFSGIDYAVFGGLLSISTAIGIYYAWKDRNEKDADAYLVGKGEMSPIPVAISLCVSYVSGIMMIGLPTQVYYYGIIICSLSVIYIIGAWITGTYYIPLFFRLDIISVYEILEMRFGRVSRVCAASAVIILMLTYMGMVTYIPCLALSAVSPISIPLSITLTCVVCTFYTTLGGIKAVIWTDVVQAMVMVFGMISVISTTTMQLGGFSNVFSALDEGHRLNFVDLSLDPRVRYSTFSLTFGTVVVWTMMSAVNQPMVQRYLSLRSEKQAKIAVWIFLIPQQLFFWLAMFTGMVMYAYFATCDPLTIEVIDKADQALPYMVLQIFKGLPGLAGIFVAAVYSGTLSTISSGINALSAVLLSDFLLQWKPKWKNWSLRISKILVLILGLVVLAMTFLVQAMGEMVVDIFLTTFGSIGGPLMAVYTMAVFMPWINEKGSTVGHIVATAVSFWISIGQILYPPADEFIKLLSVSVSGCPANSTFVEETTIAAVEDSHRPFLSDSLYAISSNYIGLLGFLICLTVGVIVSGITGFEDPKKANTNIFTPIIDNKILPASVIKFFRFGVPVRERAQSSDSDYEDSETSSEKIATEI